MKSRYSSQSGFSLVELLVGLVISLLVLVAVISSLAFTETQKRITLGTNVALESLSIASLELSKNVRMAGFGVTSCLSTAYLIDSVSGISTSNFSIKSNNSNTDALTIFYGDSNTGYATAKVSSISTNTTFSTVDYMGGLKAGSLALLSDSTKCEIHKLNAADIVNNSFITATAISSAYTTVSTTTVSSLSELKQNTYSIVNNELQEADDFNDTSTSIVGNIVAFKAYYGLIDGTFVKADNSSGKDFGVLTADTIKLIRSIRVFMVSKNPIKDICNPTLTAPVSWLNGPVVDLSADPNWKCYHYKSIDYIIPLINAIPVTTV